jgi:hypothetical protein
MVNWRRVVVGVGAFFLLAGLVWGTLGVWNYQKTQTDLSDTETVEGTIISTDVREETTEVGDGRYRTELHPQVNYTYSHEGQNYTSQSLYPGNEQTLSEGRAEEIVYDYDSGDSVTVYVNTDDPSRSFLVTNDNSLLFLLFSGAVGIAGIVIGLVTIKFGLSLGSGDDDAE